MSQRTEIVAALEKSERNAMKLEPLVVDIETYFDKDYSLRKLNYVEYATDSRMQIQMVGVRPLSDDMATEMWVHDDPRYMGESISAFLTRHRYTERTCVAHNAVFDVFMLYMETGLLPKATFCTQLAALYHFDKSDMKAAYKNLPGGTNALDSLGEALFGAGKTEGLAEQMGKRETYTAAHYQSMLTYLARDLNLTAGLAVTFGRRMPAFQRWMIDWCVRAFCDSPLVLDPDPCHDEILDYDKRADAVLEKAGVNASSLSSNVKFADVLDKMGIAVPMKHSPTTGQPIPALGKNDTFMIGLHGHPDEGVRDLAAARELVKSRLGPTRAAKMIKVAELMPDSQFPIHMQTAGAHTNRMTGGSGGGGNPLNLTRGSNLRRAVRPAEGLQLLKFDYTGIELRIARILAGDTRGVQAIKSGTDIYMDTICNLRRIDYEYHMELYRGGNKEAAQLRRIGKVLSLACQYGTGHKKARETLMAQGVALTQQETQQLINGFRYDLHPALPEAWDIFEKLVLNMQRMQSMKGPTDMNKVGRALFANSKMNMPDTVIFKKDGIVWPATGRKLRYKNIQYNTRGLAYTNRPTAGGKGEPNNIYGALVFENACQSLTAEIIEPVQRKIEKQFAGDGVRVALQVYDELVMTIPKDDDPVEWARAIEPIATAELHWWPDGPPLDVEFDVGDNYADMERIDL